jgi:uncharacterized membrane protein YedE/YeeE
MQIELAAQPNSQLDMGIAKSVDNPPIRGTRVQRGQRMQADWLWGLGGGLIIGTAAALFLLINGRIMGASSIFGALVDGTDRGKAPENLAFVAGLIAVPAALTAFGFHGQTHLTSLLPLVVLAGVCVGLGTRLANGCTSGHGVCGISRLSLRGIVATVFYLLGGGLSVVIFRHLLGVI